MTHLQIPWSSLPAFIKGQTWQTVGRGLYLEGDTTGVGSYEDDILVMFPDIISLVTNITVTVLQVQYAVILVDWRFPQTQHPGSPSSTGQSHLTSCILQECQQSSASPPLLVTFSEEMSELDSTGLDDSGVPHSPGSPGQEQEQEQEEEEERGSGADHHQGGLSWDCWLN